MKLDIGYEAQCRHPDRAMSTDDHLIAAKLAELDRRERQARASYRERSRAAEEEARKDREEREAVFVAQMQSIAVMRSRVEALAAAVPDDASLSGGGAKNAPPESGNAKAVRTGTAADLILEALDEAGDEGLSGRELNERVMAAGIKKWAAEKAKVRLKASSSVIHDEDKRWWYRKT